MRTVLRACMYAVACAAGVDMYIFAAWWAEVPLGLPWLLAQLLAVLAGVIVAVVTVRVGWAVYVAIRRYMIARRRARSNLPAAPVERDPLPVLAEPVRPAALSTRSSALGPARDAPYRESAVLPPARTTPGGDRSR